MSENADQHITDLITEFAKASNQDIDVDAVQEAFPEFNFIAPDIVGLDGLDNHPNGAETKKKIGEIESQLDELKKAIVENTCLLNEMKSKNISDTPAVDEALFQQRIAALQRKHADLNYKIQQTNVQLENKQDKKKTPNFLLASLLFNSFLAFGLLYLLWQNYRTPNSTYKSDSSKSLAVSSDSLALKLPSGTKDQIATAPSNADTIRKASLRNNETKVANELVLDRKDKINVAKTLTPKSTALVSKKESEKIDKKFESSTPQKIEKAIVTKEKSSNPKSASDVKEKNKPSVSVKAPANKNLQELGTKTQSVVKPPKEPIQEKNPAVYFK